jgi:4-hydroxy-2-oxoheptanedioate aldolase
MTYLKQRLAAGECLIGAGMYSNSPDVVEWAARGMDWIWWDCQHTHGNWQDILLGVRTAQTQGIPVLIRTWTHDGGTIERLLDTGAEGIIVPMVNTVAQAQAIVLHCSYPPIGNRSYGSTHVETIEASLDEWNKRIVMVLQLETPEAVANAEAIASLPGVDALHVGMRDLALRMGKAVDDYSAHTAVGDALEHVAQACRNQGKAAAVIVSSDDELVARMQGGYLLICAGFDTNIIEEGWRHMREVAQSLRSSGLLRD